MDLTHATLAGRYDIIEPIGAGGMGTVYRARDRELDEIVALKVIRAELANDAVVVERFRHEVKLARRVTHQNVARTFELGHADGLVFCTMELVEGESLTRRLARTPMMSVAEAIAITQATCEALTAAHAAGVIHRDIKPDNILLATDGRIVVADFGVAAIRLDVGDMSGTPAYMAPEQARGEPATPAADVYAVGLVLFELLYGERAFVGDTSAILADKQARERLVVPQREGVSESLGDLVVRSTSRDLERRITSARELHDALAPWARARRAMSGGTRPAVDLREVATVIALAPRAIVNAPKLYLAQAVHEGLLARLARTPHLRLLYRVDAPDAPAALTVALHVGDMLAVTMARGAERLLEVTLPLEHARLELNIEAIVGLVTSAIGSNTGGEGVGGRSAASEEAASLLLQAQYLVQRDIRRVGEAIELLERARLVLPDDPRIAANLAIANVRRAYFAEPRDPSLVVRAAELARIAIAMAPQLADAQLAVGYVELNTGEPIFAAGHFRQAIACAPYAAEAHECLGRMLLEAGFLEAGIARLDHAIAISPSLAHARWEIVRAWALEGRWAEHDALVAELLVTGDRLSARARSAWWRGDRDTLAQVRAELPRVASFSPRLVTALIDVYLDNCWMERRAELIAIALDDRPPTRRLKMFVAQLVAEVAGHVGETDLCLQLIKRAVDHGLYDLPWLERCVLLAPVRSRAEFAVIRTEVKRRAHEILDALYGDRQATVPETMPAVAAPR